MSSASKQVQLQATGEWPCDGQPFHFHARSEERVVDGSAPLKPFSSSAAIEKSGIKHANKAIALID